MASKGREASTLFKVERNEGNRRDMKANEQKVKRIE